ARAGARGVRRGVLRELGDVGPRREDEGLAREDERAPLLRLDLVEQALERLERSPAERRRLRPVLTVPDRDERDVVPAPQLELCCRHTCSQTTAQPMPMPMQSAVRP